MLAEIQGIAWLCGKILEWESQLVQEEFVITLKYCSKEESESNSGSDLLRRRLVIVSTCFL